MDILILAAALFGVSALLTGQPLFLFSSQPSVKCVSTHNRVQSVNSPIVYTRNQLFLLRKPPLPRPARPSCLPQARQSRHLRAAASRATTPQIPQRKPWRKEPPHPHHRWTSPHAHAPVTDRQPCRLGPLARAPVYPRPHHGSSLSTHVAVARPRS